ncbi:MAG: hypothetical protein E7356_03505 [Clostridiales bacterium]|nr:hypothetical protein [Clostridiales bacterium]
MNNFIQEIVDTCKLPFGEISKDFKIIWIGIGSLYICNYRKLVDYNTDRIVISTAYGAIEVVGDNLVLRQINKGEMIVSGEIISISRGGVNGKKEKSK